jgi:hypothetical protein
MYTTSPWLVWFPHMGAIPLFLLTCIPNWLPVLPFALAPRGALLFSFLEERIQGPVDDEGGCVNEPNRNHMRKKETIYILVVNGL